MELKNKVGLGALTTGLLGASLITGTVLANQSNGEDIQVGLNVEGASDAGNNDLAEEKDSQAKENTIKPAVAVKRKRGSIKSSELKDSENGINLQNTFKKLGTENECKRLGGDWSKSGNCKISEEIKGDMFIEPELLEKSYLEKDDCYKAGGYYAEDSKKRGTCNKPGMLFKEALKEEISSWEKYSSTKAPEEGQKSLTHFYNNGFLELREKDGQFAVVFLEDKLKDEFEDWKFPNHFKKDDKSIAMNDVCEWANKTAGNNMLNTFLYNEKTGEGWHCLKNSRMIFIEKE